MILDLFFPPLCFHCHQLTENGKTLCGICLENFSLINPIGHCKKCFSSIPMPEGTCVSCRRLSHPFKALSTCFDSFGPAKSLLHAFFSQKHFRLADDFAAYLLLQLDRLSYPSFHTITMMPKGLYNPHYAIGVSLSKLLNTPFRPLLKHSFLPEESFKRKKRCRVINQNVLLLGDEMTTRTTMRDAGWALLGGHARSVYGLTVCATLS